MSKYHLEDEDRLKKVGGDRYRVTVEFLLAAESPEDAEQILNDLIRDGILVLATEMREEDKDCQSPVIDSYDILDSEPAEIDLTEI